VGSNEKIQVMVCQFSYRFEHRIHFWNVPREFGPKFLIKGTRRNGKKLQIPSLFPARKEDSIVRGKTIVLLHSHGGIVA